MNFGEWRALKQIEPPEIVRDESDPYAPPLPEDLEWRRCSCGFTLAVVTTGLDALDVPVPEEVYRRAFPYSMIRAEPMSQPKLVAAALRWLADRIGA
jgi:hypothetical protein